jgi:hypothetical protein
MNFKSFKKRDDLCSKGQSRVLQCDKGTIIKTSVGWFATADKRLWLIPGALGVTQPTVGPYKTAYEAYEAYERAWEAKNGTGTNRVQTAVSEN